MNNGHFPPGWDEERVRRVLAHYETQTEEEAVSEDERAFEDRDRTIMEIPVDLVPVIRRVIARHKATQHDAVGSNVVILTPDVAEFFPDSESVNEALRALINIVRQKAAA